MKKSIQKTVKIISKLIQGLILIFLATFLIIGCLRIGMILDVRSEVYTTQTVPEAQAALVFGAGLLADKTPSAPLRDRVDRAIELYQSGKVKKILMSGDNRFVYYNEPEAMRQYALTQGVPDEDIILDYAGRRTYDSCYRASHIFELSDIILVTQNYHLPRALFLCNHLNITAAGVPADQTRYLRSRYVFWRVREIFATVAAYADIYLLKPVPVLGEPEPIFSISKPTGLIGIDFAKY